MFQYFVFDYHMAPVMLFDKIISFTVRTEEDLCCSHYSLFRSYFWGNFPENSYNLEANSRIV